MFVFCELFSAVHSFLGPSARSKGKNEFIPYAFSERKSLSGEAAHGKASWFLYRIAKTFHYVYVISIRRRASKAPSAHMNGSRVLTFFPRIVSGFC